MSSDYEVVGESKSFLDFQESISTVAKINRPVLLIGERGTGKEMAARRIHYLSQRWQEPFITLNCATLAPSLLESELFGHEAGAFTGANKLRRGRFEMANGGTLFLDEIGQMPLEVQEKVLRTVEYGVFERVGSTEAIEVDVRILGATNADLPELRDSGQFRSDLLDRLTFEVITLPPLRYRGDDILLLTQMFATRMSIEIGLEQTPDFTESCIKKLFKYEWPGNVRELKNVIERAVYKSGSEGIISDIILDPFTSPYKSLKTKKPLKITEKTDFSESEASGIISEKLESIPLLEAVQELEILRLKEALDKTNFHQGNAADSLGLSYHQFRRLLKKHAIEA